MADVIDLTNIAHAPSIEFQKKLAAALQRTERATLDTMSAEEKLAYLSRLNAPKGCRGTTCYGRGYVGKTTDGKFIPCPKCIK